MSLTLIQAPAVEPVTLSELREATRVDPLETDALLGIYLKAARRTAEFLTGRAIITQTWEMALDDFSDELRLAKPPVQSVVSVQYYDIDGTLQSIAPSDYVLDAAVLPGWIVPAGEFDWPETDQRINSVIVRFVCGYTSAAEVPEDIKHWIMVRVGTALDNREEVDRSGKLVTLPFFNSLLAPHATEDGALWGV